MLVLQRLLFRSYGLHAGRLYQSVFTGSVCSNRHFRFLILGPEEDREDNQVKKPKPSEISTYGGLLYVNGEFIPLPAADWLADMYGFSCAERMVKALEEGRELRG